MNTDYECRSRDRDKVTRKWKQWSEWKTIPVHEPRVTDFAKYIFPMLELAKYRNVVSIDYSWSEVQYRRKKS